MGQIVLIHESNFNRLVEQIMGFLLLNQVLIFKKIILIDLMLYNYFYRTK